MSGQPVALALVGLILSLVPQTSTAQEKAAPPAAARPAAGEPRSVGDGVTKPVKIAGAPPIYTDLARRARLQGTVILEAIIDERGDVTDVRVLKGLPMGLDLAAVEAVKTWKFEPATFEGMPVKVYYSLTVNFRVESGPFRGPAFSKFLAANPDFAKALNEARHGDAAQLLDRTNDPESTLARVYLLLEQDLLDDAWREAQRYEGANRHEVLLAVAAFALQSAQAVAKDAASRTQAIELGLEAATAAIEAQAKSIDAMGYKMLLLREKFRQTTDPAERQRLTAEATQLEQRTVEIRRADAAHEEPAAEGDEPLRVGGEVMAPQKISGDAPVPTEAARKARVSGTVVLAVVIDERGEVTDVLVAKRLPMGLDQAAVEAVKTWKFEPATLRGRPVKVYHLISVPFPETPEPQEQE